MRFQAHHEEELLQLFFGKPVPVETRKKGKQHNHDGGEMFPLPCSTSQLFGATTSLVAGPDPADAAPVAMLPELGVFSQDRTQLLGGSAATN